MNRIFAIIVTYFPQINKLRKLVESIQEQNVNTIIVNNSSYHEKLYIKNCEIINLKENMGIAFAQNKGLDLARKLDAQSIVFFDQDSSIENNFFSEILTQFNKKKSSVFVPLIVDENNLNSYPQIRINKLGFRKKIYIDKNSSIQKVDIIISSGTFLSMKTMDLIGPMSEELFIDFVDTDFAFKCRNKNISIFVVPTATILHSVGQNNFSFLGKTIFIHEKSRVYFQFRNAFILLKKSYVSKIYILFEIFSLLFHHIISVFYVKNKFDYLKNIIKGTFDGLLIYIK